MSLKANGEIVDGVIDSYKEKQKKSVQGSREVARRMYTPRIKYCTTDGSERFITHYRSSIKKSDNIGDKVKVIYTNDYRVERVYSTLGIYGATLSSFLFGIVFLLLSIIL